jgi:glycosyltransferase involved in cell wall biosynthesis
MKIMYIAFASSSHTIKWVNYFRDIGNDIMIVSFYPARGIEGMESRYIKCRTRYTALLKVNQVKKLLKEFKPDILHAHYASSCGIVAALTGFHPYVLSTWGDDILEFPKKSPLHRWAVKQAILKADHVTATSNMLCDHTRSLVNYQKEVRVIPFGVDLQRFHYIKRSSSEVISVGTVRNLRPKYGLEYLIKAFAELLPLYNNIRLTIVGDGYLRQKLNSLVKDLDIENYVTFIGAVPNEEVVDYLKKFDIFVMPSIGHGETFGVAAVEAMATGLPVVASNIGGLPEVVDDGKTGILVKPGDVEALKKALEYYILSKEARIEHGRRGREKVKAKYDWRKNGECMNQLYKEILNRD